MGDSILMTGDKALFDPTFGVAVVAVQPGQLAGSGPATITGKPLCVAGDESKVLVPGCTYTTATHAVPGVGTLKIAMLGGDQKAAKTNSGGKPVLLRGSAFTASFEVQDPAKQIPPSGGPPVPDPTPMYSGTGKFITTNTLFQGT